MNLVESKGVDNMEKIYGGAISITREALMQLLKIKGELVHITSDPVSGCFEFYFKGGAGEFPEIAEGNRTPRMKAEYTCQQDLNGECQVVKVDLVDIEGGFKCYPHYEHKPCNLCIDGTDNHKVTRPCYGKKGCKHQDYSPLAGNNMYLCIKAGITCMQPTKSCDECEIIKLHIDRMEKEQCFGCLDGIVMIDHKTAKYKDCFRSSKCKHLKAHIVEEPAEKQEETKELIPCRYFPKSWSCSYPEDHCSKCRLKKQAESSQCSTCHEDSLKCRSYGKPDCKMAYLKFLYEDNSTITKRLQSDNGIRLSTEEVLAKRKEILKQGDETKNESTEKKEAERKCKQCEGQEYAKRNWGCYKSNGCKFKEEDKKEELNALFRCPYNTKFYCDQANKGVGGMQCISCDKRTV